MKETYPQPAGFSFPARKGNPHLIPCYVDTPWPPRRRPEPKGRGHFDWLPLSLTLLAAAGVVEFVNLYNDDRTFFFSYVSGALFFASGFNAIIHLIVEDTVNRHTAAQQKKHR